MERQDVKDLKVQIPSQTSSFVDHVVASPMTQLAQNFEGICTRTPTGPSKSTPRRKLSLGEVDNNSATPILSSSSFSRTLSSESGYCPSPDRPCSLDSPSADFLSSRRRSFSKLIRRPGLLRSISSPLTSRNDGDERTVSEEVPYEIPEEQLDQNNNNKENKFEFAKPTLPIYKSMSGKRQRPTSAPPALSPGGSSYTVTSDSIVTRFSVDEDDDGFIDYSQLEQTEDETFTVSSAVAGLMTKPLTSSEMQVDSGLGNTPKCSGPAKMEPCDLFHPITCVASPTVRSQRSKSLSMKRPMPPRDPSPEERKRLRGRCSSVVEASWNSPLLVGVERVPAKSPFIRSMSDAQTKPRPDIGQLLTIGQDNTNLTGDMSKQNILPTIKGQHADLRTVTPETVTRVLDLEFQEIGEVFIVDCRYPYEYEGGHITTALNLHTKEEVYDFFMKKPKSSPDKRTIVIFHCEFSSKRAPSMYRYLRNKDRDTHRQCYPKLFYPEIYVIQGGYKSFFEICKAYCEPQTYRPMAHENYTQEFKRFSKRSKSWTEGQTVRRSYRQGLKF